MIRRFVLILGSLYFCVPSVHAAIDPQQQTLQTIETDAYKMATRYFMYTVTDRSPDQKDLLNNLIVQTQALVDQAHDSKVTNAWDNYHKSLLNNPYDKQNMVVQDTLFNVLHQLKPLTDAVQNASASAHLTNNNGSTLIYQQTVLMERMTAEYLLRASDPMGGSIVATTSADTSDAEDPQQMALEFSKNMDTLLHTYTSQKKVYTHLWNAYRYWNFIKSRIIDFNSKSVPYIVSTFDDNVSSQLNSAYDAAN